MVSFLGMIGVSWLVFIMLQVSVISARESHGSEHGMLNILGHDETEELEEEDNEVVDAEDSARVKSRMFVLDYYQLWKNCAYLVVIVFTFGVVGVIVLATGSASIYWLTLLLLVYPSKWAVFRCTKWMWPDLFDYSMGCRKWESQNIPPVYERARIEGFTDGVFVIAATLTFLEVHPDLDLSSFKRCINHSLIDISSFMLSFCMCGFIWCLHYEVQRMSMTQRSP